MFFWTILGIVVIFPRVDSSTEVSRGAFTLTPFPPSRRRKYRRLIESRAAKIARFFFSSSWSSICFACARSRSSFATRAETSACWRSISSRFSGIFRSIDWATEFTSDDLEAEQGDDQHNEAVPKARRDLAVVEHARQDAVPEGVDDRRDEERDSDVVHDLRQVLREGARDSALRTREGAARLEHLREERHVQDPDRNEEHEERDVDDRDVRRHRDLALVLRELALLRVVGNHRQDVGDVSARVGGF